MHYFGCRVTVSRRVYGVKAVGQDCNGRQPGIHGGPMGGYVDAISKSAHDNGRRVELCREVVDEARYEIDSIGRCVTRAYDAYHVTGIDVTLSKRVQHQRCVVALGQSRRVVAVAEI